MDSPATPAFGFANTKAAFNRGVRPKIAMNDRGVFVTTFSDRGNWMYYAIGTVSGVRVRLQESKKLKSASSNDEGHRGYVPAVAMNDSVVVEMHVNDRSKQSLYYSAGTISGMAGSMTVSWSNTTKYDDDGLMPALTNIDGGRLIAFYTADDGGEICYHVGTVSGSGVTWADGGSKPLSYGSNNIKGDNVSAQLRGAQVVIAYEHDDHLYYAVGTLNSPDTITWLCNVKYDGGHAPSVVLKDDLVYEFHEGNSEKLWQRVGRLSVSGTGASIAWLNWLGQTETVGGEPVDQYSYEYDVQYVPAVAGTGNLMVQVCAHGDEQLKHDDYDLYCTASRLIDRGNWMGNNIAALRSMTLRDITMPASHDAGMYTGDPLSKLGRTQNLDFLGQCLTGSRYFDIRPTFSRGKYYCYHNYDSTVLGATIDEVLASLTEFLNNWGSQELLILKLSHYGTDMLPSPGNALFMGLIDKITAALGDWLIEPPAPGKRFADMDIASLIGDAGGVLVVCDGLAHNALVDRNIHIYAYRDWQSIDPQNGDLTVFDIYSDTTDLDQMMNGLDPAPDHKGPDIAYLPNGQIPKWQGPGPAGQHYLGFSGTCYNQYNGASIPCDMFLLSWTLTPITDVWDRAQKSNGALVDNIPPVHANTLGRAINLIYVDYVSYSHATDVACVRNSFVT